MAGRGRPTLCKVYVLIISKANSSLSCISAARMSTQPPRCFKRRSLSHSWFTGSQLTRMI